ncbi:TolC family protein [Vampirovibrio chlorellavorus]|uniref:TolC family protein n=1 Tax=Vampirovibrio chlorellavorus TaxID=758823 RepID=UPI0026EF944B|nr:TolC family protein [Vampirovibrio chlorellavorus]
MKIPGPGAALSSVVRLATILLWVELLFISGWAQATDTLTLEKAFQEALVNNPSLQAKKAELLIKEAEIVTASARLNPAIISDNGVAEKTYRLGIEQTIQLGGKRQKQIELSKARRDVLLAEIQNTAQSLRREVRHAYTHLYDAQQRLQTAEDIAGTNQRLMIVAEKRQEAGDVASLDVQYAKLAFLKAKNDAYMAFGEVASARTLLNALLGKPLAMTWDLTPPTIIQTETGQTQITEKLDELILQGEVTIQQATLEHLVNLALENRAELHQNLREMTVAERQLALAKANRLPDVSLTVGPDLVAEPGQRQVNVFAIANVPVPLFNRQQGPIQEAKAQKTQLEAQQKALKNSVILEVTNAYYQFTVNRQRIRQYEKELLPTAERVLVLSRQSFEVGKTGIYLPLAAQESYMNTRMEYLKALDEFQDSISNLERAVGKPL